MSATSTLGTYNIVAKNTGTRTNNCIYMNTYGTTAGTLVDSIPAYVYKELTMSSSGKYILVVASQDISGNSNSGRCYYSTNYGNTFLLSVAGAKSYSCGDISSTGQYALIGHINGYIYSTNYLRTVNNTTSITGIISVKISANGQYQFAMTSTNIYMSNNYDLHINKADINTIGITNLTSMTISSSGQYLTVVTSNGLIWKYDIFKNTWMTNTNTNTIYNLKNNNYIVPNNVDVSGNLSVQGTMTVSGQPVITSDYRIKTYITQLDNNIIDILKLNPVSYTNTLIDKNDYGFIAHELQNIIPLLVTGRKDDNIYQSVNYIGLIPILIKEIQNTKLNFINEMKSLLEELEYLEKEINNM